MSENADASTFLFENMVSLFSTGELRELAFVVNVDWDELRGEVKSGKVISLLKTVSNRYELPRLIALLEEKRDFIDWPSLPTMDLDHLPVEQGNVGKNEINVSGGGRITIGGKVEQYGNENRVEVQEENSSLSAGELIQRGNCKS